MNIKTFKLTVVIYSKCFQFTFLKAVELVVIVVVTAIYAISTISTILLLLKNIFESFPLNQLIYPTGVACICYSSFR